MKTSFYSFYKTFSSLLLGCLFPFYLQAQSLPEGILEQQLHTLVGLDTVTFNCLSVTDSNATMNLAHQLHAENYPLTMLTQKQFSNYFQLLEKLGKNLSECQQLEQNYAIMDGLNALREKKLFDLIQLEKQRADMFKEAQEELKKENTRLSEQLTLSTEIANKNLRGRLRKNLSIGILGGVAGFTTGVLIGVLAAK